MRENNDPMLWGMCIWAAITIMLLLCGCTALRLRWQAQPVDCRNDQGVPIACPDPAWPGP